MKSKLMIAFLGIAITVIAFSCSQPDTNENKNDSDSTIATANTAFGGYEAS